MGKHISICGMGGAGKTTFARGLNAFMQKELSNVIYYHGFAPSENIDSLRKVTNDALYKYFNDELISLAYLLDLRSVYEKIQCDLENGGTVLTERFWLCSKVFSSVLGVNQFFIDAFIKTLKTPDLVILLDIDPEVAYKRLLQKSKPMENNDGLENLIKARKMYLEACASFENVIVVDNTEPLSEESYMKLYRKILNFAL
ncbi:deoxynucleoside kinase [Paenibacillus sp. FSL R5-0766]|uniref:dTMP kinase n=1 Tax=unclassified Paenibacillus TaxID=185978 RepID=UPI00096EF9BC|nr:deoxynucleoside kinase [Paenibacillus sp. FSL R5-0765]OMF59909.1 hypothetical protein BK141_23895 [Paenibacillus sp. FSL R5-0765]